MISREHLPPPIPQNEIKKELPQIEIKPPQNEIKKELPQIESKPPIPQNEIKNINTSQTENPRPQSTILPDTSFLELKKNKFRNSILSKIQRISINEKNLAKVNNETSLGGSNSKENSRRNDHLGNSTVQTIPEDEPNPMEEDDNLFNLTRVTSLSIARVFD